MNDTILRTKVGKHDWTKLHHIAIANLIIPSHQHLSTLCQGFIQHNLIIHVCVGAVGNRPECHPVIVLCHSTCQCVWP